MAAELEAFVRMATTSVRRKIKNPPLLVRTTYYYGRSNRQQRLRAAREKGGFMADEQHGGVSAAEWWKQAVVYQIYPRSFKDANGDGLGDIPGVTKQMGYLEALGVDAIWLSPFYPSNLADGGYDVIDYRNVDPRLGMLEDFDEMVRAAHASGIKVIVDIVPNHTSDCHVMFQEALAAGPGSPERDRYIFRPGRGEAGELPPNDWQSSFGGPAWERVADGEWYLHLFAKEQPDLNWKNPEVHEEFKKTLRFWSDRGVDGFRVDVAHALVKDLESRPLDEFPADAVSAPLDTSGSNPLWDRPEVHQIYREWREVFNEYEPPRFAVGEAWVHPDHQYLYASPEELGQVFNFEFAKANWCAADFHRAIEEGLASAERSGSTTTWVMSNHDVVRHASRYGLPQVAARAHHQIATDWVLRDGASYIEDRAVGERRARAAILMELALPGSVYIYQGEELGLFEVADIPWDRLEDPQAVNTSGARQIKGRDGCRVPLPWCAGDLPEPASWNANFGDGATGTFGFADRTEGAPAPAAPHLPQPLWFEDFAVDREEADPASMLALYRGALQLRARELTATGDTGLTWLEDITPEAQADKVVAFGRPAASGGTILCVTNFGETAVPVPEGEVLLSSIPLENGVLPRDATVWVRA